MLTSPGHQTSYPNKYLARKKAEIAAACGMPAATTVPGRAKLSIRIRIGGVSLNPPRLTFRQTVSPALSHRFSATPAARRKIRASRYVL
jgi:hypothetical protein